MLNFCPFEFKDIDMNNLAYELVFPNTWNWEKVKEGTVIGTEKLAFINENDTRRNKHFKEDTTVHHVILLETKKKGGKNGFQRLLDLIENNNRSVSAPEFSKTQINEDLSDKYGLDEPLKQEDLDDDEYDQNEILMLEHKKIHGIDAFVDEDDDVVMYAMPCCPKCHNRLPIGWDVAEDFAAVSLMAPTGGGKTTFLYSMMNKNWSVFKQFRSINDKQLSITSAHREYDRTDTTYYQMTEAAKAMCQDYGTCPPNTDPGHWIPPVFLNVQFDGHTMIIGIYDNSGENLIAPDLITNTQLSMLLDKMFADIYLFDPADMNITLPQKKDAEVRKQLDNCFVLDIEKQGSYQIGHAEMPIQAKDLLFERTSKASSFKNSRLLEVYDNNYSIRQQNHYLDAMKGMYFHGVVIKSDLLENVKEIASNSAYRMLFDRGNTQDILDVNMMSDRSDLVEDMIEDLQLFKGKNLKDFRRDYGKGVSWHCISALGCDAEMADNLLGEYAPIRVEEPLMTCILNRIRDNGWMR